MKNRILNLKLLDVFYFLVVFAVFGFFINHAWQERFLQDDAFISFRYAFNLAQGNGLVFNVGERLEGYTNFLYTILMTIPHLLNIDVEGFSNVVNFIFWLLGLFSFYKIVRLSTKLSATISVALTTLVASNSSYAIYATGGLETAMVVSLVITTFYLFLKAHNAEPNNQFKFRSIASVVAACAMLTRLDAFIPLAFIYFFYFSYLLNDILLRDNKTVVDFFKPFLQLILPIAAILFIYMGWKYWYYGDLLPNTYYAKISMDENFAQTPNSVLGKNFVYSFFKSYYLFIGVVLALFALLNLNKIVSKILVSARSKIFVSMPSYVLLTSCSTIMLWLAYIISVGGDFMEYRFAIIMIPFITLIIAIVLNQTAQDKRFILFTVFILTLSGAVNYKFLAERPWSVESKESLEIHVYHPMNNWKGIGQMLKTEFSQYPSVTLATTAAGAIPYFSELTTVDMLGLNDKWIALNGMPRRAPPGHQKIANYQYLIDKNVDFIIGHPQVIRRNEKLTANDLSVEKLKARFWIHSKMNYTDFYNKFTQTKIVRVPLNGGFDLLMVWVNTQDKVLAKIIDKNRELKGWEVYSVQESKEIINVDYNQLQNKKAMGSRWNASGNIAYSNFGVIEIDLAGAEVTRNLELSLDHNDSYTISLLSKVDNGSLTEVFTNIVVPSSDVKSGLVIHSITLPSNIDLSRIQKAKIAGVDGDGFYSLGHFSFLK